ncbi:MAG: 2-aminoethylphosphonate aminotransferase [Lysobacterales bacterium]
MRAILLNPGPVSLSEGVRRAAVATDLCHREAEFYDVQDRVRERLTGVYELDSRTWCSTTLGGSGTTALEAMLSSLLPGNSRLLVVENGVYGERLSQLARVHGIVHDTVTHGLLEAWDLHRIADKLANRGFSHVAAVHHETTCGRLNPVRDLAGLCEQFGVDLLLDTVSSFAAEEIPFESSALLACAATANKCLHGIPGLCMVVARRLGLAQAVKPPRSLTLNLALWAEHQERRSTPFTPAVNSVLALDQALAELAESGGWQARHVRYRRLADRVAQGLAGLGVETILPAHESSCVLRAYRIPPGRSYAEIHVSMKQRGFVVYAGQGNIGRGMFRISTMGDISDYDLDRLLEALEAVFA